jgi:cellulose synthase/poly-beta-1,6-N-acetylglucosamine synthase-like glycosyltransferase
MVLMVASAKRKPVLSSQSVKEWRKFIIAIAAHDEAAVIENTVRRMLALDYPSDYFSVHVVADHCSDATAILAQQAGAVVYERRVEPRNGKGAALTWLFEQLWQSRVDADAIIVFDADTVVDKKFLHVMNMRLQRGSRVIQGQHIIANPKQGWFPLLTWAMFLIDNRFQNQGRVNLGWSAKHMGDSICFQIDVLKQIGWGSGLTEDYQLRQKLLLEGIRIDYEPDAKGYGEAPVTWTWAGRQRSRWLRGTHEAGKEYAAILLRKGIRRRNLAMIEGAMQAYLPSFSSVALIAVAGTVFQVAVDSLVGPVFSYWVVLAWFVCVALLLVYPFFGLVLESAPAEAYLVIMTGPVFILWRSWLAFKSRYLIKQVSWIRTAHGGEPAHSKKPTE